MTGTGEAEELSGAMTSHGLFNLLGVAPLLGRTFMREEDKAGRGKVVMLSYGVWQRRFGGDPKIVGQTVTLVNRAWEDSVAYALLFAAFIATAALSRLRVRAGFFTNYLAEWIYLWRMRRGEREAAVGASRSRCLIVDTVIGNE